jgi:hypothetical protein
MSTEGLYRYPFQGSKDFVSNRVRTVELVDFLESYIPRTQCPNEILELLSTWGSPRTTIPTRKCVIDSRRKLVTSVVMSSSKIIAILIILLCRRQFEGSVAVSLRIHTYQGQRTSSSFPLPSSIVVVVGIVRISLLPVASPSLTISAAVLLVRIESHTR